MTRLPYVASRLNYRPELAVESGHSFDLSDVETRVQLDVAGTNVVVMQILDAALRSARTGKTALVTALSK